MKKNIVRVMLTMVLALNMMIMPVLAAESVEFTNVEPRLNNIASARLIISFDTSDVVYCNFVISPLSHCTGFEGIMRLYDSNNTLCKSWAVSDRESPFDVEKTYQGINGETYTLTFQGYAYGEGTMFDDIELSVTSTNPS